MTTGCRAESVGWSPPRLRPYRLALPDYPGIGLTPHKAAKLASNVSSWGCSLGVTNRVAATSGPTPSAYILPGAIVPVTRSKSALMAIIFAVNLIHR